MNQPLRLAIELADQLAAIAQSDPRVWVIDGDLGDSYGLYDRYGKPKFAQFVQAGIAEQSMIGMAAGLAAAGKLPWVFSFSSFLCCRAFDQIRTCVAHTSLPVVMVGSHAGAATGSNGQSHAALNDIALISSLGNISICAPADALDIAQTLKQWHQQPRPQYIRTSREPVTALARPSGLQSGGQPTAPLLVCTTGLASHWLAPVQALLAQQDVILPSRHLPVFDSPCLDHVLAELTPATDVIVIEDHSEIGGLADSIRRRPGAQGRKVHALAWPAHWHGESGALAPLRQAYGMDTTALCRKILKIVQSKEQSL